jgi:transposase-like protein
MEKAEKSKSESVTALAAGEPKMPTLEAKATAHGKRYGQALKRLVVEQIECGKLTVAQAQRQLGIAGAQTIRSWQAKYGKAIPTSRKSNSDTDRPRQCPISLPGAVLVSAGTGELVHVNDSVVDTRIFGRESQQMTFNGIFQRAIQFIKIHLFVCSQEISDH